MNQFRTKPTPRIYGGYPKHFLKIAQEEKFGCKIRIGSGAEMLSISNKYMDKLDNNVFMLFLAVYSQNTNYSYAVGVEWLFNRFLYKTLKHKNVI